MDLAGLFRFLAGQPLLLLGMVAIFVTVTGGMIRRSLPKLGRMMQGAGNLGLLAAFLLTIAQVARVSTGTDLALPQLGMPSQSVAGNETRIEMANDGHFWLDASVNGHWRRFLVDTGATITAISESTAVAAEVPQKSLRPMVLMRTANGTIQAELATIGELRVGNIVARDLDTVVAPELGETNVLGMNLLSRLASWRVEGRTLILVPKKEQAALAN